MLFARKKKYFARRINDESIRRRVYYGSRRPIYSAEEAVNEVRATMAFEDMDMTEEDVRMLYAYKNGNVSGDDLRQEEITYAPSPAQRYLRNCTHCGCFSILDPCSRCIMEHLDDRLRFVEDCILPALIAAAALTGIDGIIKYQRDYPVMLCQALK